MASLTPAIEQHFRDAGWFPRRSVPVARTLPSDHPAYDILKSFGGLSLRSTGAGKECARSNIEFRALAGKDESIRLWQALLKTGFEGLGEIDDGHAELWMDGEGRMFLNGVVAPMLVFLGENFADGMETLLCGLRGQPMLLPAQDAVCIWGEWFSGTDDGVLTPASFGVDT